MKGKPMTKEQITKIMHLYGKGMSGRKIAAEVGMSHAAVHQTISSNSIRITSKAKSGKKPPAKNAKVVRPKDSAYSYTPFTAPADAKICNATATGLYTGTELSYRRTIRA